MLKGKDTGLPKVPELIYCSFDVNFKMMVMKHAEEINNFFAA
jgi:hypothetical protein